MGGRSPARSPSLWRHRTTTTTTNNNNNTTISMQRAMSVLLVLVLVVVVQMDSHRLHRRRLRRHMVEASRSCPRPYEERASGVQLRSAAYISP